MITMKNDFSRSNSMAILLLNIMKNKNISNCGKPLPVPMKILPVFFYIFRQRKFLLTNEQPNNMNKVFLLILILVAAKGSSQTDENGNPVFNSITLNEETVNDFQFSSNYYTLKTNIDNKHSSVYISDHPTLD